MGFITGIVAFAIAVAGVSQGNAPTTGTPDQPTVNQGGGGGQANDPQKVARLLALLHNPQQSIANVDRFARARGGQRIRTGSVEQPNGSKSSNISQGNVPTNNNTSTATAGGGGGTIGTVGITGNSQTPQITVTRLGNLVDRNGLRSLNQLLATNATELQALHDALNNSGAVLGALSQGNVDVNDVIAVDALPNGGLEIFTK